MVIRGTMEGIAALPRITQALLATATTLLGLFVRTVISLLGLNTNASDQYLAIIILEKILKKTFGKKGLAPENLSRSLDNSGSVTSVLIL